MKIYFFPKSGHDSRDFPETFSNVWKMFPENPLSHAPKSLKSLLEKVSRKSPESLPGFFDPVSFELKYLYQVRYEVFRDIMSRCTNPPPVDAT